MLTTEIGHEDPEPGEAQGPAPKTSWMAITSLVLGLLGPFSMFLSLAPGFVLGVISLIQIHRSRGKLVGRGMAIAGVTIPVLLVVILYPVFIKARETAREDECCSNLKMVSLAIIQYAADYDDTFCPATDWNQAIYPYTKSNLLTCPTAHSRLPAFAMNKSLGAISLKSIRSPEETAGVFESIPGVNQAGGPELLPVPGRHLRHNFIGFADGHTKWYKDGEYSAIRWKP